MEGGGVGGPCAPKLPCRAAAGPCAPKLACRASVTVLWQSLWQYFFLCGNTFSSVAVLCQSLWQYFFLPGAPPTPLKCRTCAQLYSRPSNSLSNLRRRASHLSGAAPPRRPWQADFSGRVKKKCTPLRRNACSFLPPGAMLPCWARGPGLWGSSGRIFGGPGADPERAVAGRWRGRSGAAPAACRPGLAAHFSPKSNLRVRAPFLAGSGPPGAGLLGPGAADLPSRGTPCLPHRGIGRFVTKPQPQ